jgi:hypothetical protein
MYRPQGAYHAPFGIQAQAWRVIRALRFRFVVIPAKAGIQVLHGIARFARDHITN